MVWGGLPILVTCEGIGDTGVRTGIKQMFFWYKR
jgi:hypothetical protein